MENIELGETAKKKLYLCSSSSGPSVAITLGQWQRLDATRSPGNLTLLGY